MYFVVQGIGQVALSDHLGVGLQRLLELESPRHRGHAEVQGLNDVFVELLHALLGVLLHDLIDCLDH